jgi:hypothetical protein
VGGSYVADTGPEQDSGAAVPVYQEGDQQNLNKHSLIVGEALLVADGHPLKEKAFHVKREKLAASKWNR